MSIFFFQSIREIFWISTFIIILNLRDVIFLVLEEALWNCSLSLSLSVDENLFLIFTRLSERIFTLRLEALAVSSCQENSSALQRGCAKIHAWSFRAHIPSVSRFLHLLFKIAHSARFLDRAAARRRFEREKIEATKIEYRFFFD